jgi:hypothetical protein
MPAPKLSGTELAGRLIALESVVLSFAGEIAATMPPDRVNAVFANVKAIAHDMVDQLAPDFSPTPPLVKDIESHADAYLDAWIEMIGKASAKFLKDAAVKKD